jgi:ubiquinone/menaquinone biosynthesis C-methylase UbiE
LSDRIKLLLFFLSALVILFFMSIGYSALNTLSRLDVVEAQRDQWQRPAEVIGALDLKPGAEVVDLGCGSGYFTLKLSPQVGRQGRVIAEDVRRLPLAFLWVRALLRGEHNVHVVHGGISDPYLPTGQVGAVLIANTFHELTDPQSILAHVRNALVSGGMLVIVDREPKQTNIGVTEVGGHEISATRVENELKAANFEMVKRQDDFIARDPYNETWWLIVAKRP